MYMHSWLGNLFLNLVLYYVSFHFTGVAELMFTVCCLLMAAIVSSFTSENNLLNLLLISKSLFHLTYSHMLGTFGRMGVYLSTPKTEKLSEDGENDKLKFGLSSMQGWRELWKMLWVPIYQLLLFVVTICVDVPGLVRLTWIQMLSVGFRLKTWANSAKFYRTHQM